MDTSVLYWYDAIPAVASFAVLYAFYCHDERIARSQFNQGVQK